MKSVALGVLTLTMLDLVIRSQANAQRASGILLGASNVVRKFIDPTVPAFNPAPQAKTTSASAPAAPNPAAAQGAVNQFVANATLPPGVIAS